MTSKADVGLIGLGTMGAALALNIADNNYSVAVFNRTTAVTKKFIENAGELAERLIATETLGEFVASISSPRKIILMVPAGEIVDAQISALQDLLEPGDLIVDAGNANYNDTNRRLRESSDAVYSFLGVGVSGGEEGARRGPSIMVGGKQADWLSIAPVLNAISAKHGDEDCAAYVGPEGAGHFVKMVHNGIEYADMQMIAEAYSLMNKGLELSKDQIASAFGKWNRGTLASYLIEITGNIARSYDSITGAPMLDVILDKAGQKGTGRWTAIEAQHLGVAVPTIEAAVCARNLSATLEDRISGAEAFGDLPDKLTHGDLTIDELERALIAGKILCYAQGFAMLSAASKQFNWDLPLPTIARIWRNGCIIRSDMLNDMATALTSSEEKLLVFSEPFTDMMKQHVPALRKTVLAATSAGFAVPALSAGLTWFDTIRTRRTSANLIQAQRDFFGAHGFERTDGKPAHHGSWGDID